MEGVAVERGEGIGTGGTCVFADECCRGDGSVVEFTLGALRGEGGEAIVCDRVTKRCLPESPLGFIRLVCRLPTVTREIEDDSVEFEGTEEEEVALVSYFTLRSVAIPFRTGRGWRECDLVRMLELSDKADEL